jgi:hypothetical protein
VPRISAPLTPLLCLTFALMACTGEAPGPSFTQTVDVQVIPPDGNGAIDGSNAEVSDPDTGPETDASNPNDADTTSDISTGCDPAQCEAQLAPAVCEQAICLDDDSCALITIDAAECEDGDPCTVNDLCEEGQCVGGSPNDCDDDNICTNDSCIKESGCQHLPNTFPCDDGNACTIGDTCLAGLCTGAAPLQCTTVQPCQVSTCDPVLGCVTSQAPEDTSCDDGYDCTIGDSCSEGVCSSPLNLCECESDMDCPAPQNLCVGTPICDVSTFKCVIDPETFVLCDDLTGPCDIALCTPETGACVTQAIPDGVLCDDGDPCTTTGACQSGACQVQAALQ